MTPKQILDSFSETLMQDERILSVQERALLASLLQHARTSAAGNETTQEVVRTVVASAVGETVAQRAFSVLGGSIVERILHDGQLPVSERVGSRVEMYSGPNPPGSPGNQPQPPGPHVQDAYLRQPQPPGAPLRTVPPTRHAPAPLPFAGTSHRPPPSRRRRRTRNR